MQYDPCAVCVRTTYPEFCTPEHTETVQRLAYALGKSLAGPPGHPEYHPEWYIDDAAAIADYVVEGDGWIIELAVDGCLGDYFKVNGIEFWIDMNAEGYMEPQLASDHRAWLAEEYEI